MLEEFIGAPLLAQKIESSYDVLAQLLNEMCDAGAVSSTEPNALRDLVEVEGWIGKLLGGMSIPGFVKLFSNTKLKRPSFGQSCAEIQRSTENLPTPQIPSCLAYHPREQPTLPLSHGEGLMFATHPTNYMWI